MLNAKLLQKYYQQFALLLCLIMSLFHGGSAAASSHTLQKGGIHFRASSAVGTLFINDQVMRDDAWDNLLQLSFAGFLNCKTHACFYGLGINGNTAWSSRFNSVNSPGSTQVSPVGIYNSPSLDFSAFIAWKFIPNFGAELGVGPELEWVKWRNSVQQTTSRFRAVPKVYVSLAYSFNKRNDLFINLGQAVNVYGGLQCNGTPFNCFNDSGYFNVTTLIIGMTHYFSDSSSITATS